jgi:hypothetical protein
MRGPNRYWAFWMALFIGLLFHSACSKRCKDWVKLPYPAQLHAYMKAYKTGSWWLYENTVGLRDSVYLTEYSETMEAVREGDRPCFGMTTTELALRTVGMDTTEVVYIRYAMGDGGKGTVVDLAALKHHGSTLLRFGEHVEQGLSGTLLQDTIIGSVHYSDILRVYRSDYYSVRSLESIYMAKNIGIVGYTTLTDTFTLTTYHIP